MENRTELGMNRTGMQTAPKQNDRMMQNTTLTQPSSSGDERAAAALREEYIRLADPLGTVPPPMTLKGAASTGMKMITGKRPQVFIDKLAERLAFERAGVRLYQAFLAKCEAPHAGPDVVPLERVRHFCEEELQHFALLEQCVRELGADPTVQTPCADLAGVESTGLMQALTDPRTTVNQSLHAILVAELADNAGWEELVVLAREMGMDAMAARFEKAKSEEDDHLEHVKRWHQEATLQEARMIAH